VSVVPVGLGFVGTALLVGGLLLDNWFLIAGAMVAGAGAAWWATEPTSR